MSGLPISLGGGFLLPSAMLTDSDKPFQLDFILYIDCPFFSSGKLLPVLRSKYKFVYFLLLTLKRFEQKMDELYLKSNFLL